MSKSIDFILMNCHLNTPLIQQSVNPLPGSRVKLCVADTTWIPSRSVQTRNCGKPWKGVMSRTW